MQTESGVSAYDVESPWTAGLIARKLNVRFGDDPQALLIYQSNQLHIVDFLRKETIQEFEMPEGILACDISVANRDRIIIDGKLQPRHVVAIVTRNTARISFGGWHEREIDVDISGFSPASCVDISPQGYWLAIGTETGQVVIQDVLGRNHQVIDSHKGKITALRFADHAREINIGDETGAISKWQLNPQYQIKSVDDVMWLSQSSQKNVVVADEDDQVHIVNLSNPEFADPFKTNGLQRMGNGSLAVNSTGEIFVNASDHPHIYQHNKEITELSDVEGATAVCINPDGKFVFSGTSGGHLYRHSLNGDLGNSWQPHKSRVSQLQVSRSGKKIWSVHYDSRISRGINNRSPNEGAIIINDANTGELIEKFDVTWDTPDFVLFDSVSNTCVSYYNDYISSGMREKVLRILDLDTGSEIGKFLLEDYSTIGRVVVSSNCHTMAFVGQGSDGRVLELHDLQTSQVIKRPFQYRQTGLGFQIAIDMDDSGVFLGNGPFVDVFDKTDLRHVQSIRTPLREIRRLGLSKQYILISGDKTCVLKRIKADVHQIKKQIGALAIEDEKAVFQSSTPNLFSPPELVGFD